MIRSGFRHPVSNSRFRVSAVRRTVPPKRKYMYIPTILYTDSQNYVRYKLNGLRFLSMLSQKYISHTCISVIIVVNFWSYTLV